MAGLNFKKYIGQPSDKVKKLLEEQGFSVRINNNSRPKINTDFELVIKVELLSENQIVLECGDFLINKGV